MRTRRTKLASLKAASLKFDDQCRSAAPPALDGAGGELIGGRNYLYGIAVLLSLSHGCLTRGSVDSSFRARGTPVALISSRSTRCRAKA